MENTRLGFAERLLNDWRLYQAIVGATKKHERAELRFRHHKTADAEADLILAQNRLLEVIGNARNAWSREGDFASQAAARKKIQQAMEEGSLNQSHQFERTR